MTNFVFLDIDGVLVHFKCSSKRELPSGLLVPNCSELDGVPFLGTFDPECVARLNRIVRLSEAKVVISSTWRSKPRATLQKFMHAQGCEFDIHDVTNHKHGGRRGPQILDWLSEHAADGDRFVSIDDEVSDQQDIHDRCVHVRNGWMEGGLQNIHVAKAVRLLTCLSLSQQALIPAVFDVVGGSGALSKGRELSLKNFEEDLDNMLRVADEQFNEEPSQEKIYLTPRDARIRTKLGESQLYNIEGFDPRAGEKHTYAPGFVAPSSTQQPKHRHKSKHKRAKAKAARKARKGKR